MRRHLALALGLLAATGCSSEEDDKAGADASATGGGPGAGTGGAGGAPFAGGQPGPGGAPGTLPPVVDGGGRLPDASFDTDATPGPQPGDYAPCGGECPGAQRCFSLTQGGQGICLPPCRSHEQCALGWADAGLPQCAARTPEGDQYCLITCGETNAGDTSCPEGLSCAFDGTGNGEPDVCVPGPAEPPPPAGGPCDADPTDNECWACCKANSCEASVAGCHSAPCACWLECMEAKVEGQPAASCVNTCGQLPIELTTCWNIDCPDVCEFGDF